MILRKPYAFLIKNFRKINIVILLLSLFVYTKTLDLISFTRNYASTGIYNELDLISNYINTPFILAMVFIIVFSSILIYLLKYKDKPIKTYILLVIEYLILIGLSIYTLSFYNHIFINGFNRQQALVISDLIFISSLPQYIILILLFIRSIGLDLKSFGFHQDKDLLVNEEDREEVEVEATFNKDKYKRNIKKVLRETKYFVLENKIYLSIIFVILLLFTTTFIYKNVYLKGKLYNMNENISSNYYQFNVKNVYITDRDYKGDIIDENSSFVILNIDVKNDYQVSRNIALNKFMLFVGNDYYVPDTSYDSYFSDMGNIYHDQVMDAYQKSNYHIIFKIKKPSKDDNFLLRYENVLNDNLIRVKLKIQDISSFIEKDSKKLGEELTVPLNLNENYKIKFNKYELGNSFNYNYVSCDRFNNCPVLTGTLTAPNNKKLMYISFSTINKSRKEIINFIKKYGKVRYIVNDKVKEEKIKSNVDVNYYGNYLYYTLNNEISNASSIEFVFTVRSYQYIYKIL